MEMTMPVDAVDVKIDQEIEAAREALVDLAISDSDRQEWWTAHELKVRARNGWSSAVMGLALRQLVSEGTFEQAHDLRVRVRIGA
jgi:hypothetical protein